MRLKLSSWLSWLLVLALLTQAVTLGLVGYAVLMKGNNLPWVLWRGEDVAWKIGANQPKEFEELGIEWFPHIVRDSQKECKAEVKAWISRIKAKIAEPRFAELKLETSDDGFSVLEKDKRLRKVHLRCLPVGVDLRRPVGSGNTVN